MVEEMNYPTLSRKEHHLMVNLPLGKQYWPVRITYIGINPFTHCKNYHCFTTKWIVANRITM